MDGRTLYVVNPMLNNSNQEKPNSIGSINENIQVQHQMMPHIIQLYAVEAPVTDQVPKQEMALRNRHNSSEPGSFYRTSQPPMKMPSVPE